MFVYVWVLFRYNILIIAIMKIGGILQKSVFVKKPKCTPRNYRLWSTFWGNRKRKTADAETELLGLYINYFMSVYVCIYNGELYIFYVWVFC